MSLNCYHSIAIAAADSAMSKKKIIFHFPFVVRKFVWL